MLEMTISVLYNGDEQGHLTQTLGREGWAARSTHLPNLWLENRLLTV